MNHLLASMRPLTLPLRRSAYGTAALLAAVLVMALAGCSRDVPVIGLLEVDLSDDMVETRTGFLEALRENGYAAGDTARFPRRNSQIREEPLSILARDLVTRDNAAMIFALGTPALQAVLGAGVDVPVIFAMSADPFAAGAGEGPARHRDNVTGVIAAPPGRRIVGLIRQLVPEASRVGILFDPADPDSSAAGEGVKAAVVEAGLDTAMGRIGNMTAGQLTDSLVEGGADVIYVTAAEVLHSAFPAIVEAADRAKIPVFGTRTSQISVGALAAYEIDWIAHGRSAGMLAARVLGGEDIGGIPFLAETAFDFSVNRQVAQALGIVVPPDLG